MKAYFAFSLFAAALTGCAAMTDGLKAVNSGGRQLLTSIDTLADASPKGRLKASDFGDAPIKNLGMGVRPDLRPFTEIGTYYKSKHWEAGKRRYDGLLETGQDDDDEGYRILAIDDYASFAGAPIYGDRGAATKASTNTVHPPNGPLHLRISNYAFPGVIAGKVGWCAAAQFEYKVVPLQATNLTPMVASVRTSHKSFVLLDGNGHIKAVSRIDRQSGRQAHFGTPETAIAQNGGCTPIAPEMFASKTDYEIVRCRSALANQQTQLGQQQYGQCVDFLAKNDPTSMEFGLARKVAAPDTKPFSKRDQDFPALPDAPAAK